MDKEYILEKTDLEDLYIVRIDFLNMEETARLQKKLKKNYKDSKVKFIFAHKDIHLSITKVIKDDKIIVKTIDENKNYEVY